MKYLILVLFLISNVALAENVGFARVELTKNISSSNYHGDWPVTITTGYKYDIGGGHYVGPVYQHKSNLLRGAPFNNEVESTVDGVGIMWEVQW